MKVIRLGPLVLSNVLIFSLASQSAFAGFGKMLEQEGQSLGEQEGRKALSTEETKLRNSLDKERAAKKPATATALDKEQAAKSANQSAAVKEQVMEKEKLEQAAKKQPQEKGLFNKTEKSLEQNAEQDAAGWATRHMP